MPLTTERLFQPQAHMLCRKCGKLKYAFCATRKDI